MKRIVYIITGVTLICLVAGGAWLLTRNGPRTVKLPGVVEVQEIRLGSKIGGRVFELLVKEGQVVAAGTPLVVFETPELKNQRRQLQAKLSAAEAELMRVQSGARQEEKDAVSAAAAAAKARWERVKFGWRTEEKNQIESDHRTAEADYHQALKEWERVAPLYRMKSISPTEYEGAVAARDRAKGRVDSAKAKLEMVRFGSRIEDLDEAKAELKRAQAKEFELLNGSRSEDIQLAQARVDEIHAKIGEIDIGLKEAIVVVPANMKNAVIEVIAVRPGDLVSPNQPVVRILQADDLWVKVFVPETYLGHVTPNKKVQLTIDSHPGTIFEGEVVQTANISEFTPRNIQSVDERRHQVFGVKIRVRDTKGAYHAGMAAEVTLPLD